MQVDYLPLRQGLSRLYDQCMTEVQAQSGLSRMEIDVLLFLANNPQYDTASEVVMLRHMSKSHVSATVEKLAAQGMLSRRVDRDNRRKVHLLLLPSAESVIRAGRAAQERFGQLMTAGISTGDLVALSRCIKIIAENITQSE